MSGEPTQTSIILLARLQKTDTLVNGYLHGIEGYVKFWITRDTEAKYIMYSPFFHASNSNDFITKFEFTGLRPGQKYFYRISYGKDTSNTTSSPWNSFKTLNQPTSDKNVSFIITNGLNYNKFLNGNSINNVSSASPTSLKTGFPAFHCISLLKPDFWIGNSDIDFYNISKDTAFITQNDIKVQWHRIFSMSEFNKMLSKIPAYWIFSGDSFYQNITSNEIPISANIQQVPSSCRTYVLNRDVQIWILGNTDAMDFNIMSWLKSTLKENNTPFKLIISPCALIGPDEFKKTRNPSDIEEFIAGKDSLFNWLKSNGLRNNGLYFVSCSPHLQYHAVDPLGFEEFSCGSLLDAGFHPSEISADTLSNKISEKLLLPYIQKEPSGGFLIIDSGRDEYNSPVLLFRYFDDEKKLLYAVNKF
jgi:alkaline phosphatase/alkaline phosphatase D